MSQHRFRGVVQQWKNKKWQEFVKTSTFFQRHPRVLHHCLFKSHWHSSVCRWWKPHLVIFNQISIPRTTCQTKRSGASALGSFSFRRYVCSCRDHRTDNWIIQWVHLRGHWHKRVVEHLQLAVMELSGQAQCDALWLTRPSWQTTSNVARTKPDGQGELRSTKFSLWMHSAETSFGRNWSKNAVRIWWRDATGHRRSVSKDCHSDINRWLVKQRIECRHSE